MARKRKVYPTEVSGLTQRLREHGWTTAQIAPRLGVCERTLYRYEAGRHPIPLATYRRLARLVANGDPPPKPRQRDKAIKADKADTWAALVRELDAG